MFGNKPADSRREEFRKYLERTGVLVTLTKIISNLYNLEEKPQDAIEYMLKALGDDRPDKIELADALKDLEEERKKSEALSKELAEAKAKLQDLGKDKKENNEGETMIVDRPASPAKDSITSEPAVTVTSPPPDPTVPADAESTA